MAKKFARLLFVQALGALTIPAGALISGEEKQINSLVKSGEADDSKGAIDYCKSENMTAVEYVDPIVAAAQAEAAEKAAKVKALEGEVALLEKNLTKAKDADKPGIQAELDVKQAELDALSAA